MILDIDTPSLSRRIWPELGISYYRRSFEVGETHEFPPQIGEIGTSKSITLLPEGLIRTWNENRSSHLDVPGRPGRIWGGLLLPGRYNIEALAPSTYVCLAPLPDDVIERFGVNMFTLESHTLQAGGQVSFAFVDRYRAVICMFGVCTVNGQPLTAGQKVLIAEGEAVEVSSTAYCEIAAYQQAE